MQTTPDQVLRDETPTLRDATVTAVTTLPTEKELDALRAQRIRFEGFFAGPTW